MYHVFYTNATWFSLPSKCHSRTFDNQTAACEILEPGGLCEGEPTGAGNCTWNYTLIGHIELDDLIGVPLKTLHEAGGREYNPFTDKGIKLDFWDGINNTKNNTERVRKLLKLFETKFPNQTKDKDMRPPP